MKLSIIVPTYNRADLIGQMIESVLAQSSPDWELVIVDDHSTDNTDDVVGKYMALDSRIRDLKRQTETKGAPACRNEGVRNSSGELLVFLDSDDLLASHCIEQRLAFMSEHPDVEMMVSQTEFFMTKPGDTGFVLNSMDYDNDLEHFLINDHVWLTTGPTWRREAFERVGFWDESLPCWQDWELHVRALVKGVKYQKVDNIDSFPRRAHKQYGTISNSITPSYIAGALSAIKKVRDHLRKTDLFTPRCRKFLTLYIFAYLYGLAKSHRKRDAFRLTREAKAMGIFSLSQQLHFMVVLCFVSVIDTAYNCVEWFAERPYKKYKDERHERLKSRCS